MQRYRFLFLLIISTLFVTPSPSQPPEIRAITLGLYSWWPDHNYGEYLVEIADTGANTVNLTFPLMQENGQSVSMDLLDTRSPSNITIRRTIRQAQRENLNVVLMPIVLLNNPGDDDWRGNMEPVSHLQWFENYRKHILLYAEISEEEKVEWLVVGSELSSLEKYTDEWKSLIADVQKIYSGRIMYSCNWDHLHGPEEWWDKLDAVGLSSYYELTSDYEANQQSLDEGWDYWKDWVLDWRSEAGVELPIFFTEVGYPSIDGAAVYPWDYTLKTDPDWEEQAMAFRAFIHAWDGNEVVTGVTIYKWISFEEDESRTYSPKGKPAEQVIRNWFNTETDEVNPYNDILRNSFPG